MASTRSNKKTSSKKTSSKVSSTPSTNKVTKPTAAPKSPKSPKSPKTPKSPKSPKPTNALTSSNSLTASPEVADQILAKAFTYRVQLSQLAHDLLNDEDKVFRRAAWPLWNSEKIFINMISHPERYNLGEDAFEAKYRGKLEYRGEDQDHWLLRE